MHETSSSSQARTAVLVLIFCCVLWGYSFPAVQFGVAAMESHLPAELPHVSSILRKVAMSATFNGWRIGVSAILYALITFRRQRGFTSSDLRAGVVLGILMGTGMLLQISGLCYTLPSTSSFLTGLSVVFAPIAQSVILRRRIGGEIWLGAAVALLGVAVLSRPESPTSAANTCAALAPIPYLGEILSIVGALAFTAHMVSLDHFARKADAVRMTAVMLFTTALFSGLIGVILHGETFYRAEVLSGVLADRTLWWVIPTTALFSTALAIYLMNSYQPFIAPAAASVVYCTESVFATIFSIAFQSEAATKALFVGGMLIIAAVVLVAHASRTQSSG